MAHSFRTDAYIGECYSIRIQESTAIGSGEEKVQFEQMEIFRLNTQMDA